MRTNATNGVRYAAAPPNRTPRTTRPGRTKTMRYEYFLIRFQARCTSVPPDRWSIPRFARILANRRPPVQGAAARRFRPAPVPLVAFRT